MELLDAARRGDQAAFERLVAAYRRELTAHCYRMLGSFHDAEDAVQESLLSVWRAIPRFEGRSSLRTWLYRICTNACLRLDTKRPKRLRSPDHGPPRHDTADLGEPVLGPVWLEPWPDDIASDEAGPAASYERRESVELAFVAALQHLPAFQRAVLILREVLEYSAADVAALLDTTPAAVNSALQRARKGAADRMPARSQQAELATLGPGGQRDLVDALVTAWERADVDAVVALLADDVRFTMPPLPAWFDGRDDVTRFLAERVFAIAWRLVPIAVAKAPATVGTKPAAPGEQPGTVNGQPALASYQQQPDGRFLIGAILVLSVRDGRITELASFLDPELYPRFGLPHELPAEKSGRER
ncbi:sigma-70 family RNA polymerase sigma factor [Jiangella asiatica]|uniref:Sigma-70 family RNA polymerase sigma factor n=1 Tax=Jiangella asiatica TaxID=2530372 RepID=A0A4V2YZS8_9ACTN|nr:sigma-70 family RNA polymerase sigma factor [Jiangella asiatica]